jgi:replicative DNA helicase
VPHFSNGEFSTSAAAPDSKASAKVPEPQLLSCASLIDAVTAQAQAAYEARQSGEPRGPQTGFKKLDRAMNGALPIGVSIVLGNTGAGKTALCVQIAATCRFPALFVSTEMSAPELFRRQMARVTGQFLGRFSSGEMTPEAVNRAALATAEAMPQLVFCDATRAYATDRFLFDAALATRGDAKSVLIVVDSLHTWARTANTGTDEYQGLGAAMVSLQNLAQKLQCPVLALGEQNRASMGSGGANSGAGNRFIEYGAEIVFDLQADKTEDGAGEKAVKIILAKNRHGAADTKAGLNFNGALQRFTEADK